MQLTYVISGVNVAMILCAYPWAVMKLDANLGTAKSKNVTLREALFNSNYNLNWLSAVSQDAHLIS